jgi:hypothetical protein
MEKGCLLGKDPGLRVNQLKAVANSAVAASILDVQYLSGAAHSTFLANLTYHTTMVHEVTLHKSIILKFTVVRI